MFFRVNRKSVISPVSRFVCLTAVAAVLWSGIPSSATAEERGEGQVASSESASIAKGGQLIEVKSTRRDETARERIRARVNEPEHEEVRVEFRVPAGLEGKVEFWKLIFSKYGLKEYVFHHREYPEIIYSVLDVSAVIPAGGGTVLPKSSDIVGEEISRIQASLNHLGGGNKPRNPFERRIKRLFAKLEQRSGPSAYQMAAEIEKIRYQQGIRERFEEAIRRSGRYLHAMERVFRERGLPIELTRLPFIESSFDYTAYSSVGAAGIWQFMRGTGKNYMRINAAIDERRDPIAATYAAAQYLQAAFNRLGSWPLAVTSYNHGVTGVLRGAQAVGSNDLAKIIENYTGASFGFASKNFYPEFLAAVQVERESAKYFPGVMREAPWYFEEVLLGKSISISELIKYSGVSREEIERLNRSLLAPILTGRAKLPADLVVRLPMGAGKRLSTHLRGSAVVGIVEPPKPKPERERRVKKSSRPQKNQAAKKPTQKKAQVRQTKKKR